MYCQVYDFLLLSVWTQSIKCVSYLLKYLDLSAYGPHCQWNGICNVHECRSVYIEYHKKSICSQIKKKETKKIHFFGRFNTLHLHHSGIARLYSSHSECYQTFSLRLSYWFRWSEGSCVLGFTCVVVISYSLLLCCVLSLLKHTTIYMSLGCVVYCMLCTEYRVDHLDVPERRKLGCVP